MSLVANAGLGLLLMSPLKHGGLALATSLAAGLNFSLLAVLLRKKVGPLGAGRILRSFGKHLTASFLMGLSAYGVSLAGDWESSRLTWEKILLLAVSLGAGLGVYGAACYLLRSEEVRAALELARRRTGKGGK